MLNHFFKLDTPFTKYQEADLERHFTTSNHLKDVLFEPDRWPVSLHKVKDADFENVSLSKTSFSKATFTGCTFRDCLFIGCEFDDVEFHRCSFTDCNFYKSEFRNCYVDPTTIKLDSSYKDTHSNVGVGLFQRILDNSSAQHQASFAMEADILFRQWKRAQLKHDVVDGKINEFMYRWLWLKNAVFDKIAGYGYRPFKFSIWTAILFMLISAVNHVLLSNSLVFANSGASPSSFVDTIYYTFSILTVLGFSTIVPATSLAKIATVSEALGGVGWLGVFTSILVKRFIR